MAEKKGVGHAYNVDFLNVVFAASSIFLFVSVLWMVWDDYDREWKNYQRRFALLEQEVTEQTIRAVDQKIDKATMQRLQQQRTAAEQQMEVNRAKIDELQGRVDDLTTRVYVATQNYQFAKANYDVRRYDFEVKRNRNPEGAQAEAARIDEEGRRLTDLQLQTEKLEAERAQAQADLGQYTGQAIEIQKKLDELTAERGRLEKRLSAVSPDFLKAYFRNAPLLDFMAPTLKVQQVITPNILDDVNFTRVPKMDRCMTCHLAIDRAGYEDRPQPFRTHSNLDVYVGSNSPHPLGDVGCTVCHEGMGQSLTFRDAAHTPADEQQTHVWEEEHRWEEPHLWDYPMLPKGMTEASCAKCHKSETFVPHAVALTRAYATYERAGCYACHKTRGFEGLRKPGPNLTRIGSKLTPEWVKTWIRKPTAIKPATWMPQPWYTSNSDAPEDAKRNEVEIDAAVAYLFEHSEPYEPAVASPPKGDAAAGRKIVESIGCLGCHINGDESRTDAGPRRTFGQPLQSIGTKTTYVWLFNWVRDPSHYSPATYMPDLRLTDRQAADVATYLTTLKGPAGEPAKASADPAAADDVLLDYLSAVMPIARAHATMAKMDARAKKLDLGRRTIARYGCFSCHEIKGFENEQPIGTELSEQGSKLDSRLDFAFVDIPHTKLDWFHTKLKDPRIFDRGRVLRPLEKLRMPDFHVSEEEARLLVTALMSLQRDIQPKQALRPASMRNDALLAGRNFVSRRNCVGCHVIEGNGGDYQTVVSDASLGPPLLTPEGAKVQPDWLYAFLRGPITIRPWLDVRMPTFGLDDSHLNEVIRYFGAVSNQMQPFTTPTVVRASDLSAAGTQLFAKLRCQQCHVLGAIPKDQPTANLAPDLRMASERLRPDWILEWLKKPSAIQPGTRMPAFWPDFPKSYFPELGGDAERQIRAIRDHLMTLRGGPNPKRQTASPQIASQN
jgi:mono/diheme cytochrome c family protein